MNNCKDTTCVNNNSTMEGICDECREEQQEAFVVTHLSRADIEDKGYEEHEYQLKEAQRKIALKRLSFADTAKILSKYNDKENSIKKKI